MNSDDDMIFKFLLCESLYQFIDKDVDREATNWPLLKNYILSTDKLISKSSRLMVNNQSPNSFSYLRQILTTTSSSDLYSDWDENREHPEERENTIKS